MSTTFYIDTRHFRAQVATLPRETLKELAPVLDRLYARPDEVYQEGILTSGRIEVGTAYAAGNGKIGVQWASPDNLPGELFFPLLPLDTRIVGNDPNIRTLGDLVDLDIQQRT